MHFQVSQKGLYLNTIVDLSVPKTIKSDEKRLKQILFNLIGNATKFTFKGGITLNVNFGDGKLKVSI
jgi:signal transduction histidine kinase